MRTFLNIVRQAMERVKYDCGLGADYKFRPGDIVLCQQVTSDLNNQIRENEEHDKYLEDIEREMTESDEDLPF